MRMLLSLVLLLGGLALAAAFTKQPGPMPWPR
ncbi:hypothetical protein EV663_101306 [Rhodovulum bhavnagarense]|uniref:Uncharacterized protein n=1 Tax=Rhodovulum bhavnagarense TaxID=992286 RepID=A0A4R2RT29_9RHOB|nr:hypothetical protein EV663_101306 [Rhodovulum bhavnagarense]